jgi:tetratricopeptide (TPR) repeat protein
MSNARDDIQNALMARRRGDLPGALAFARAGLSREPDDDAISGLVGMLYCEAGNPGEGIGYLRKALSHRPEDVGTRANLAMALLSTGESAEVASLCTEAFARADSSMRLWRLRAYAMQQTGELEQAEQAYARVVAAVPNDFESWNNLGNVRNALGLAEEAIQALQRASALRPGLTEVALNLGSALTAALRVDEAIAVLERCVRAHPDEARALSALGHALSLGDRDEEARDTLVAAAAVASDDPSLWVSVGSAHMKLVEPEAAETALRRAIALQPNHSQAYVQLGILLEGNNRLDDLAELLTQARSQAAATDAVDFIEALLLRRQHRYDEAMEILKRISSDIEPARLVQMKGELADRMGDTRGAFAAFEQMNRLMMEDPSRPRERAARYRDDVRVATRRVTPQWVAGWRPAKPEQSRPDPIFLVGFPRSGTTLLDTLLMGHPAIRVLEERPPLRLTEAALGPLDRLATLGKTEIDALRARYFAEVDAILPYEPGTILVDKFPLYMNKAAVIHRLFPDARFIFAERHPCDVVLSCFITSFSLNYAMSNFLDLRDAAILYDLSFTCWERARTAMPLKVFPVRYERILADRESELRGALEFIGLPWNEAMLDHEGVALARGNVRTASYSQVTEPIYDRAKGRWMRYREYLDPVIPILEPWINKMGYSL